jgi:ubiquinone biosynthesis protein
MTIPIFRGIRIVLFFISSYINLRFKKDYKKFVSKIECMGPTFIKLGQSFATRSDIINSELSNELLKLCDNVKGVKFNYIKLTIEKELNKNINEIFREFHEAPVASASIAQVHKATMFDGRKVAVKVLRPDVEKIFKRDIKLLFILARIAAIFLHKRLNLVEIIERFARGVDYELDLRIEAASASELKENTKNDIDFYVPEIFWNMTSRRVLSLEWIDGIPLTRFNENNPKIVNRLILIFFKQVYRDGFFHADVHPGNIFIMPNNKIAAVDFGIMGRIDRQTKIYLIEIIRGFLKHDYHHIAEVHFQAGYVDRKYSQFSTACRAIGEPIVNKPLNEISIANLLSQLFKLATDFNMEIQPHLLLLQKNLMLLEGNCAKLAPNTNMWKVINPFIKNWYYREINVKNKIKDYLNKNIRGFQEIIDNGIKVRDCSDHSSKKINLPLYLLLSINLLIMIIIACKL